MPNLTQTFRAMNAEAQFTREMLGAGATQIRYANYASRGVYFQAFTGLSTGLERIGKLCLMIDHYIEYGGRFPDPDYMQKEIGHRIVLLYEKSKAVVAKRGVYLSYLRNLDDPIHQAILTVLSDFARGDRYCNIDLLVGNKRQRDPVASWFRTVDQPLFESRVLQRKRSSIRDRAIEVADLLAEKATVLHTSETGDEITEIEDASYRTGMQQSVAPLRQLCVVQIIRYWVELLIALQNLAMQSRTEDIPFFTEVFQDFYIEDSYIRKRKTWDHRAC